MFMCFFYLQINVFNIYDFASWFNWENSTLKSYALQKKAT